MEQVELKRYVVKVGGASGQGINSIGEILAKALKNTGYYIFGYREYPSLIKGGYSSYQIDISDSKINSSSNYCDLLVCIGRSAVHEYLKTLRPNGNLIHNLPRLTFDLSETKFIESNNIKVFYVDTDRLIRELRAKPIMSNTIMLGLTAKILGVDIEVVSDILSTVFDKNEEVIEMNIKCLEQGYSEYLNGDLNSVNLNLSRKDSQKDTYIMTGNHSLALGAVAAGVRAYYAYPMTPSSSILTYLSEIYKDTKMVVRQIDDEISVAQMMIGSNFMGARALVATSGGGFDLMTESVSMAAMTETPAVFILAQRPGPATGLPTWTAQGDLNLAIYSGHGEYAKCVIAVNDIDSCFVLIQKALNISEKFQIPVILLTDKQVAESLFNFEKLPDAIPIERHIVAGEGLSTLKPHDRYMATDSGVSKRWIPGSSDVVFGANSDEHTEDGSIAEESENVVKMYGKRMRKFESLMEELPEPELITSKGDELDILFVGWGSVKNTVLDCLKYTDLNIGYLHYEYIYPLKSGKFLEVSRKAKRVVLIENNYLGQLGELITKETGFIFEEKLLKYDGRPFFVEDILDFLNLEYLKPNMVDGPKLMLNL